MSNQEPVFDYVGESPKYNRNKRRRFQRQRSKALAKIPSLKRTERETRDFGENVQRKRRHNYHVSECTSEEEIAIKMELDTSNVIPQEFVKAPVKFEKISPKVKVEHGIPFPSKIFPGYNRTPVKRPSGFDRPPQPSVPNQVVRFRNPQNAFESGQAGHVSTNWKSGNPFPNPQLWKAPPLRPAAANHFINSGNQNINPHQQWHAHWNFQNTTYNSNQQGNWVPAQDRVSRNQNFRPSQEPRYCNNMAPVFRQPFNNK